MEKIKVIEIAEKAKNFTPKIIVQTFNNKIKKYEVNSYDALIGEDNNLYLSKENAEIVFNSIIKINETKKAEYLTNENGTVLNPTPIGYSTYLSTKINNKEYDLGYDTMFASLGYLNIMSLFSSLAENRMYNIFDDGNIVIAEIEKGDLYSEKQMCIVEYNIRYLLIRFNLDYKGETDFRYSTNEKITALADTGFNAIANTYTAYGLKTIVAVELKHKPDNFKNQKFVTIYFNEDYNGSISVDGTDARSLTGGLYHQGSTWGSDSQSIIIAYSWHNKPQSAKLFQNSITHEALHVLGIGDLYWDFKEKENNNKTKDSLLLFGGKSVKKVDQQYINPDNIMISHAGNPVISNTDIAFIIKAFRENKYQEFFIQDSEYTYADTQNWLNFYNSKIAEGKSDDDAFNETKKYIYNVPEIAAKIKDLKDYAAKYGK